MGGDGVRTGCGVGEREQTAKALGDGTGGRFNVGYREEAGEVKDDPPQNSWWRVKSPVQSGPGNQV